MDKTARGFRQLSVWQKSYEMTLDIYRLTRNFPKSELYGMTSQIQRAAVSIPANISEGYDRNHKKEYVQFLSIARGSLGELETLLMLAKDLGYLSGNDFCAVDAKRAETARMIQGLIRSLS
ncbi:MAG: four helix bundle protein [Nitrospiraceae bacterium]|nr:four helix bundle protein [Nitrospiraceae bacterium]